MKKQKKQLFILGIILAVCMLVYFVLRITAFVSEKKAEEAAEITILQINPEEINGFSFEIDGEMYRFNREDAGWICENDPSLNLDPAIMEVKAGNLEKLDAKEKIDQQKTPDEYGLENPANVVTVYTEEKDYELLLGDYNWLLKGYYLSYEEQIYLIPADFYRAFTCTLDSMIAEGSTEE